MDIEILGNHQLQSDRFDKILEFLYWCKEKEFEIARLSIEASKKNDQIIQQSMPFNKVVARRGTSASASEDFSPEDQNDSAYLKEELEFNRESAYGRISNEYTGKLSKTRIWHITKSLSDELASNHSKEFNNKFGKFGKTSKFKVLVQSLLWGSALANRADRWTNAKDIGFLLSATEEINLKLVQFSESEIIAATEFIQDHWDIICKSDKLKFNTTFMAERLDKAYKSQEQLKNHKEKYNVLNSPFISKLLEKYNYIDRENLRKRIEANNYDYRGAFSFEVMMDFKDNRPPSIPDDGGNWKQQYLSQIDSYKLQLEKDIETTWHRYKFEQTKWDAERVNENI